MRVLLIEKDLPSLREVKQYLDVDQAKVDAAVDDQHAIDMLNRSNTYELVLLGRAFDQAINERVTLLRKLTHAGIVIISASQDEEAEVLAFKAGADSYITIPLSRSIFAVRLQTVARRARRPLSPPPKRERVSAEEPQLAKVRLDVEKHLLIIGAHAIMLTKGEFSITKALLERPGMVLSRQTLLDTTNNGESQADDRIVDSYVKFIRNKLRPYLGGHELIRTIYGVGYVVDLPP